MKRDTGDKISLSGRSGLMAEDCNGCAVCLLSCPVWRQSHDQTMTFCGRMRSMQGGAEPADLAASVNNCTLCGSCEPVCSYGIESVMMTIDMRVLLGPGDAVDGPQEGRQAPVSDRVLLANPMLLADRDMLEKTLAGLGEIALFKDNGDDLSEAMETGRNLSASRIRGFMESIKEAREVVVTDGLLFRLIKKLSPEIKAVTLGEALLRVPDIQSQIGPDDMYVIDARAYNADFKRLVGLYDNIRRATSVMMNLDLHRVAIPTGSSLHAQSGIVDPVSQAEWILRGRHAQRVILERMEDLEPFRVATDLPVIFLPDIG